VEEIAPILGVNQLGVAFLVIACAMIFFVPSRYVHVPIVFSCLYMTIAQQTVLFGIFHFTPLRILFFVGWTRLIVRREFSPIQFNAIDKALIVWIVTHFIINVALLYGTEAALVNRLGYVYDTVIPYFFYRIVIKDFEDVEKALQIIAILIAPLATIMIFEKITGRNIFVFFGGVPEISMFREGGYRAQGPFRSPIIAGTFGATMLPLFVGLWWKEEGGKFFASIGVIAATIITIVAHSGGPASAYVFGVISLILWKFRDNIKTILRAVFFIGIFLHLIMQAPVWHLFARLSGIVGGTGWHRAYLIDMAVEHFDEWWLIGTTHTAHWMPYALLISPDHADITNQFIAEGIHGGLLTMILFIILIFFLFRGIHNGLLAAEELDLPFEKTILIWAMGASLVTHVLTYTSVTYFDQMIAFWYLLLAMVSQANNLMYEVEEIKQDRAENTQNNSKKVYLGTPA